MMPLSPELPRAKPCLLLVDDTPENIDVLVSLLKSDYALKVANRGAKALQICAASEQIDLILLDVMMPEMDGFEVCRQLRAQPATRDIPIIFLTGRIEADSIVRGFEIGANDYVTKPFRPHELLARVRTHLTLRAQQREIAAKNTELKETLQIVAHDVNNQFAVLSMAVEIIHKHPEIGVAKFLPRMSAAIRNGVGLTNMVRDLRRAEDKGLQLQAVPLQTALEEALLLAEDESQKKQLTFTNQLLAAQVVAEPYALTNCVFGNIISNAIKFSPHGGNIRITVEAHGDLISISFRDSGIGMPPPILASLFDISRSRSRVGTNGEKGTGFGMPLMRRFVTAFGGRVEVASRDAAAHPDDHGTEIRIHLKRAQSGGMPS